MLGRIDGAHCTYGATVQWDNGTRYYIDSACLTRVHWRVGHKTDAVGSDLSTVTEHADYADALDAFRCLLESIAGELFGESHTCECDSDDECEPCAAESDARSWLADRLTGRTDPGPLEFAHRPESWGVTALFRLERI
ncbi:hypothetical protein I0C86_41300 [Plantactinospora sp. S1510]|uniref:Uncharacterized protein n=1 Tax=Plantactinospora alkalitolerans TaxID=2789879 RepID=A0ABS0H9Y5_9ACTN|nr:hypothetical protein [Plantactinospora alkalitolerans]MBF9135290.1 hypothetical protein [Plantactinospora alkalitolerans]